MEGNGGQVTAEVLGQNGTDVVYTLSGGHIFPIYDGCVARDIKLIDVRHEATAAFAAEGHAKLSRSLGVAAVTAGPGVTNCASALTSAQFNGSSVLLLGGRAPAARWGTGSLQEMDHIPVVSSITKFAATVTDPSATGAVVQSAIDLALSAHRGPTFVDFPVDQLFSSETESLRGPSSVAPVEPTGDLQFAAKLLCEAERPVLVAGTDVWWEGAWLELAELAALRHIPVVLNGMGRGLMPADHPLVVSRARGAALRGADVVVVIGTSLDFRIGFGEFGSAKVIHLIDAAAPSKGTVTPTCKIEGSIKLALRGLVDAASAVASSEWAESLSAIEIQKRQTEQPELESESDPIHPVRVYGELAKVLDDDAIVVCDGGDFVSFAGKYVNRSTPGTWLDSGAFGCLGSGAGNAIAARICHPDKQVVMLLGDGAAGFSLMDFDTMVRHKLPVVAIVGNNDAWMLEKNPMKMLYGYDVAADLNPNCRYDKVVEALGGGGELVTDPRELEPALERAFKSGVPYLLNVKIDPGVFYPRSANLM